MLFRFILAVLMAFTLQFLLIFEPVITWLGVGTLLKTCIPPKPKPPYFWAGGLTDEKTPTFGTMLTYTIFNRRIGNRPNTIAGLPYLAGAT